MSMASIQSYLVTKVKGFAGVDQRYVFPYENPAMAGYPSISVTLKDWTGKFLTNAQNKFTYTFTIRIYQEVTKTNEGIATAESNLVTLSDTIISSFDSDNKLGNNDVWTLPVEGKTGWVQSLPIRYFEVDVVCNDVVGATG